MVMWIKRAFVAAKANLVLYAGIAFVALFGIVKIQSEQKQSLRRKNKTLNAQIDQANAIAEAESELDQTFSHRAEEAQRDIKAGKMPENIKRRNEY